ncbi:MAG: DUF296 domain-containing protein [Desulfarculaceae bacterium]|nr:DUF296 domain-containing protein [Desulfarculaceae bacterium]MCF8066700.1 DUF296 domain-containing protein [Desulfarculaceae bacterium]MCF8096789.1 DUF296 domain-containing protein [Desulfarculaceae bacterium]MCF8122605.1 DUF296 domain-containing protein [Desulfarculaceae bacterium]
MRYSEAKIGRVFVVSVEDGERLPDAIEAFAREQKLTHGLVAMLGAIQNGELVSGPDDPDANPVTILTTLVGKPQDAAVLGTIFPDEDGNPMVHLHGVMARGERVSMGCLRLGVHVWEVAEVVVMELSGTKAVRRFDPEVGFSRLVPDPED